MFFFIPRIFKSDFVHDLTSHLFLLFSGPPCSRQSASPAPPSSRTERSETQRSEVREEEKALTSQKIDIKSTNNSCRYESFSFSQPLLSLLSGYDVKKDTVVFINNHELSFSERYWKEGQTEDYVPRRFLKQNYNR